MSHRLHISLLLAPSPSNKHKVPLSPNTSNTWHRVALIFRQTFPITPRQDRTPPSRLLSIVFHFRNTSRYNYRYWVYYHRNYVTAIVLLIPWRCKISMPILAWKQPEQRHEALQTLAVLEHHHRHNSTCGFGLPQRRRLPWWTRAPGVARPLHANIFHCKMYGMNTLSVSLDIWI